MSDWRLETPVAFLVFNRPDTTARVFAEIARAKPPKLLVVADGPRKNRLGEAERCAATRAIIKKVDWECEVLTNYSEINLGCKNRVSSGLDWIFEQVPEAIILEDDCLPNPTFFRFCAELLERYREDERIAMISGDNFQFGRKRGDASYYFSRYNHIWGWASWRRAWCLYDNEASIWPFLRESKWLDKIIFSKKERRYWTKIFDRIHHGEIDTWDHQWTLSVWYYNMLSVLPNVNLISNIGFGKEATHTLRTGICTNMEASEMEFPLVHPDMVQADTDADIFSSGKVFNVSLIYRIFQKVFPSLWKTYLLRNRTW